MPNFDIGPKSPPERLMLKPNLHKTVTEKAKVKARAKAGKQIGS